MVTYNEKNRQDWQLHQVSVSTCSHSKQYCNLQSSQHTGMDAVLWTLVKKTLMTVILPDFATSAGGWMANRVEADPKKGAQARHH